MGAICLAVCPRYRWISVEKGATSSAFFHQKVAIFVRDLPYNDFEGGGAQLSRGIKKFFRMAQTPHGLRNPSESRESVVLTTIIFRNFRNFRKFRKMSSKINTFPKNRLAQTKLVPIDRKNSGESNPQFIRTHSENIQRFERLKKLLFVLPKSAPT